MKNLLFLFIITGLIFQCDNKSDKNAKSLNKEYPVKDSSSTPGETKNKKTREIVSEEKIAFYSIDSAEKHVKNNILKCIHDKYVTWEREHSITDENFVFKFNEKVFYYFITSKIQAADHFKDNIHFLKNEIGITGNWDFRSFSNNNLFINISGNIKSTSQRLGYYGDLRSYTNNKAFSEVLTIDTRAPVICSTKYDNSRVHDLYTIGTSRQLAFEDIDELSIDELAYLRNEFYARKGYIFKTKKMKNYFSSKEWYHPQYNDVREFLPEIELENIFFIKNVEEGKKLDADKTVISKLYRAGTTGKLTKAEIVGLNIHQLNYLRNEFYARKGYIFKTTKMKKYFANKAWYKPRVNDATGLLSDLELQNVYFIKSIEKSRR